jgi:hypothetical protein
MDYFLTSPRLGFRCWTEDDLPLAAELLCDPKVTAFMGGPFTPELAQARLAKGIFAHQFPPKRVPLVDASNERNITLLMNSGKRQFLAIKGPLEITNYVRTGLDKKFPR